MNRSEGEKLSAHGKRIRWLVGLYRMPNDPRGAKRADDGTPAQDQMHMAPNLPARPIFAEIAAWNFNNLYDVNRTNVWTETSAGTGTVLTPQDEHGGVAAFVNGAGDNNYYTYISRYEPIRLSAGRRICFRGRFKVTDADQADLFFGLSAKVAVAGLFDARQDSIGVYLADGSASLAGEARKNGTATPATALLTVSDDDWVRVHINIDGTTRVRIWIDDAPTSDASIITNLPDDTELTFAFGCRNGQGVANGMSVGQAIAIIDE